ncbi:hypothetical protein [Chitinophaga varians]|uniref:hypothetical protein n=1 Tax=Chitinophaga varians TaxID=2202339 RepID=UPI00165F7C00|nr:hypothetical protein [Chitinophaga varians]MBC9914587.1 hypothetical protein [Chitinophaga varians]
MGPWLHICAQCGAKEYYKAWDLCQPEVHCRQCGFVKVNPPEEVERMRRIQAENSWYAGFVELLFAIEDELGIEYNGKEFPEPFATWRTLLEATLQYTDTAITEAQVMEVIARCAGVTETSIREKIDKPIGI